jgi:hypothetical protein
MEHFEKLALDSVQQKPSLCLWYVDVTFVVWPHSQDQLQIFLSHLNSLCLSIHFTVETESDAIQLLYARTLQQMSNPLDASLDKTYNKPIQLKNKT